MIRPLMARDFEAFQALRIRALATDPDAFLTTLDEWQKRPALFIEQQFRQTVAGPDTFMMGAFVDDQLVGMMGLMRQHRTKTQHRADIWGVYVAPEYRGRGFGRALLGATIEATRQIAGVLQIHLTVMAHNTAAIDLYHAHGFQTFGVEKRSVLVDDRPLDELHMQLFLDGAES